MSKHITEEQRYAISMMLQIPMSKKAIAEAIGVDKSTVYREIKRIKWIENKLNNRPRKRLGYLTPNEKFKQIINQNSVAFAS